jgi:methanogenic corrinoid protein MtbC1
MNEDIYQGYLASLIRGDRVACTRVVRELTDADMPVKSLYQQLFQRSLYMVGELWECNKISVAVEHMATSLTEGLMNQIYTSIIPANRLEKTVIVASVEDELHQVGAKMVADIFEIRGWNSLYLGANTPTEELLRFIRDVKPDVIALSLSVYFHMGTLEKMIRKIRDEFQDIEILIGGQAFRFGGSDIAEKYPGVFFIPSLDALEDFIIKGQRYAWKEKD